MMDSKKLALVLRIFGVVAIVAAMAMAVGSPSLREGIQSLIEKESEAKSADDEKTVPAPLFTLNALDGSTVSLKGLRGKWVFVNFWAKWCGPCVAEAPQIDSLAKKMKGKPFTVITINLDDSDAASIKDFMNRRNLSFTVLLDKKAEAAEAYGISALPMTFVINPAGEVVAQAMGPREWDSPEMIAYFISLMKEGSGSKS